jgi:hypothetical protein
VSLMSRPTAAVAVRGAVRFPGLFLCVLCRSAHSFMAEAAMSAPAGAPSRRAHRSRDLNLAVYGQVHNKQVAADCAQLDAVDAELVMHSVTRPEARLTCAAARGDVAEVRGLVAGGAPTEPLDVLHPGWTPLHAAVEHGHEEVVRVLLASGADPDVRDELTGATPFLWGECVRARAFVAAMQSCGLTAAHAASQLPPAALCTVSDNARRRGMGILRWSRLLLRPGLRS